MMDSNGSPEATSANITDTSTRVPLMHGLPWHTLGFTPIRSCHLMASLPSPRVIRLLPHSSSEPHTRDLPRRYHCPRTRDTPPLCSNRRSSARPHVPFPVGL